MGLGNPRSVITLKECGPLSSGSRGGAQQEGIPAQKNRGRPYPGPTLRFPGRNQRLLVVANVHIRPCTLFVSISSKVCRHSVVTNWQTSFVSHFVTTKDFTPAEWVQAAWEGRQVDPTMLSEALEALGISPEEFDRLRAAVGKVTGRSSRFFISTPTGGKRRR